MTDVIVISSNVISSGRHGANRGTGFNALGAETDAAAVAQFLDQCRSPETYRAYKREIRRLLAWATYVPRKCLSSLTGADLNEYGKFLSCPPKKWCEQEVVCDGEFVRLFHGPLSLDSQRHAFACIGSLFKFLVRLGYLQTFPLMHHRCAQRPNFEVIRKRIRERQLDANQQKILFAWLHAQTTFDAQRVRFFAALMLYMGLRINEVANHKMNNFVKLSDGWVFQCTGKGDKYEELVVPPNLLVELTRYRKLMGLSDLPSPLDTHALAMSALREPIGVRRISGLMKDACMAASNLLPPGRARESMQACSAHWFRHMFVARMAQAGIPIEDIKKLARHYKAETSFLYLDTPRLRRHAAMQSFNYDDVMNGD